MEIRRCTVTDHLLRINCHCQNNIVKNCIPIDAWQFQSDLYWSKPVWWSTEGVGLVVWNKNLIASYMADIWIIPDLPPTVPWFMHGLVDGIDKDGSVGISWSEHRIFWFITYDQFRGPVYRYFAGWVRPMNKKAIWKCLMMPTTAHLSSHIAGAELFRVQIRLLLYHRRCRLRTAHLRRIVTFNVPHQNLDPLSITTTIWWICAPPVARHGRTIIETIDDDNSGWTCFLDYFISKGSSVWRLFLQHSKIMWYVFIQRLLFGYHGRIISLGSPRLATLNVHCMHVYGVEMGATDVEHDGACHTADHEPNNAMTTGFRTFRHFDDTNWCIISELYKPTWLNMLLWYIHDLKMPSAEADFLHRNSRCDRWLRCTGSALTIYLEDISGW